MANRTAIDPDLDVERPATQRQDLKVRHATALAKLMAERADLRGAYAFADVVNDSLRWSA